MSSPYVVDSGNVRIFSDMDTGVYAGPVGTALPVDFTAPAAAVKPVGWLGDDGIDLDIDKDADEYHALQGGSLVRKKVTRAAQKFTFVCWEDNAIVMGIVYADQPITVTGTGASRIATQNIAKDQAKTVTRALVVDAIDGAVKDRYCLEKVDLTVSGTIKIAGSDVRAYTIEATVLAGSTAVRITNSPGVVGP